jgi:hypothetical protein
VSFLLLLRSKGVKVAGPESEKRVQEREEEKTLVAGLMTLK